MAVYTNVTKQQLDELVSNYGLKGNFSLTPISEGIENSNYFLTSETQKLVLTIYEKRLNPKELPFFLELMNHLAIKGINCPVPLKTKSEKLFDNIADKPCAIISFLKGRGVGRIENYHLSELGSNCARLHLAGLDFTKTRQNDLSLPSWIELFSKVDPRLNEIKPMLSSEVNEELQWLKENWPKQGEIKEGIIHADLFPDNAFFLNGKLSGIIDFYFACNDFLMYDLAICLNAWCFENGTEFNITKAKLLLKSYDSVRKISDTELAKLPVLASGAAMRFFLTRSYDRLNPVADALVKPKNPLEYLHKLRFHKGVKSPKQYGL